MVLSEPEGLLKIATADLETAEASSDPAVFREGAWGFWLQQAVEKALKAWLLQLGGDPPLTHDLPRPTWRVWLNSPSMPCNSAMTPIPLRLGWIGRPSISA